MRIAIGADERTQLTDFVVQELLRRDFGVQPSGALDGSAPPAGPTARPDVAQAVARLRPVDGGQADEGANVLCLGLRSTSEIVAREILDAWFSTAADPGERENVEKVNKLDERHRPVTKAGAAVSLASGEKGTV